VHMNGRIYDPVTGRFLQADPLVQDPFNGQSYNRYGYVLNNPLSFTDPTGFSWWTKWGRTAFRTIAAVAVAWITGPYVAAAISTAAGEAAAAEATAAALDAELVTASQTAAMTSVASTANIVGGTAAGFAAGGIEGGNLESAVYGAFTAGVFASVNVATLDFDPYARIATKALVGGAMARAQGGSFSRGLRQAILTSIALETYTQYVGFAPDMQAGENALGPGIPCRETGSNCYEPDELRDYRIPLDRQRSNVFGLNEMLTGDSSDPREFWRQSGPVSQRMNEIPGLNSVAQLHDTFFIRGDLPFVPFWNVASMASAVAWTYAGLLDGLPLFDLRCFKCQK